MNILIIGATSGIGRELWKQYTAAGNQVAVVGRRTALLNEMQQEHPQHTLPFTFDVSQHNEVASLLADIQKQIGIIHLAIVCAGIGDLNPDLRFAIEEATIRTNILGWTALVDSIMHIFIQQESGHLATITSVGGLTGEPQAPAYSATKAYQINYTQALYKKARPLGIHVTEIRPGLVDTAMAKGEGLFWVMPVEKVAKQIIAAIAKKKARVIVTKRWSILAFIMKHFVG